MALRRLSDRDPVLVNFPLAIHRHGVYLYRHKANRLKGKNSLRLFLDVSAWTWWP